MPTPAGTIRKKRPRHDQGRRRAIHIEDQVEAKRCGHLPGKQLVSTTEMVARIKAAVKGKTTPDFIVIAGLTRRLVKALPRPSTARAATATRAPP